MRRGGGDRGAGSFDELRVRRPDLSRLRQRVWQAGRGGRGANHRRGAAEPERATARDAAGQGRALSTHDQLLGGPTGQSYFGCRFPAEGAYASAITREAAKVGARLAAEGVLGRFAIDFVTVREKDGAWKPYAIELNLRKGGTTHPFLSLQFLTDGIYDAEAAVFTTPNGQQKCLVASDHVVSPAYRRLSPDDLFDIVARHGLHFDQSRQTGVVLHMMSALGACGLVGTAVETRTKKPTPSTHAQSRRSTRKRNASSDQTSPSFHLLAHDRCLRVFEEGPPQRAAAGRADAESLGRVRRHGRRGTSIDARSAMSGSTGTVTTPRVGPVEVECDQEEHRDERGGDQDADDAARENREVEGEQPEADRGAEDHDREHGCRDTVFQSRDLDGLHVDRLVEGLDVERRCPPASPQAPRRDEPQSERCRRLPSTTAASISALPGTDSERRMTESV